MMTCRHNFIDFANVFKAFVGSAYLSIAYWFRQCGLILSLLCVLLIAVTTDYCTHLIIKCKCHITDTLTLIDKEEQNITEEEREEQAEERERISRNLTYAEIADISLGKKALYVVNAAIFITQFGCTIQYIIFLGNTIQSLFPFTSKNGTNITNVMDGEIYPVEDNARVTTSPIYELVVLIPIPFFLVCALLRDVRKLAPISLAGNAAIFCGFFATISIIYSDFDHANDIEYFRFASLPLFFGSVSGSFEGIATVIPVESSMVGNRHMYPYFLHITISLLAVILSTLGVTGYLRYGGTTQQIIIQNLVENEDSIFLTVIYSFICLSVALTYPLQLFPVIEVIEKALFLPGKIFGPKISSIVTADSDSESLIEDNMIQTRDKEVLIKDCSQAVAVSIPNSVSSWKRNIVRVLVVAVEVGIAILFKDQYAYFGSIIGTIGGSILGFLMPPLIHIKLRRQYVSLAVTVLHIFILVVFGIVGGMMGLGSSIKTIIERMTIT